MTLKELLHRKDKGKDEAPDPVAEEKDADPTPIFTFMRSDTNTQELISPPNYTAADNAAPQEAPKRFSRLRSSSNVSPSSSSPQTPPPAKSERRLSQRLHLSSRSRGSSQSSVNVPSNLPEIQDLAVTGDDKQAQWEERATILAKESARASTSRPRSRSSSSSSNASTNNNTNTNSNNKSRRRRGSDMIADPDFHPQHLGDRPPQGRRISDSKSDDDIQAAITLHEAGRLEESTAMFGRLADDKGNAMAQIMYGLALRHGWGVPTPDPARALAYLSQAAASSASVESAALAHGVARGGAAKGELVLAIYELANSFRHAWGVPAPDPLAARKYYEVAANLGDTDAMNETGWCYENAYGGKKDKYAAAQYYRLAERNGSKTVGNSWIWKDKYNPPDSASNPSSSSTSANKDMKKANGST